MQLYRHRKGKAYLFLHKAIDTENLGEVVVYQALYGESKVWCRPLPMFMEGDRFTEIDVIDLTHVEFRHLQSLVHTRES